LILPVFHRRLLLDQSSKETGQRLSNGQSCVSLVQPVNNLP
jgi:hypothetical protein